MKKLLVFTIAFLFPLLLAGQAGATLIGVSGPSSILGVLPAIIGAPADALDDIVTNTGMQGFDEAQGVTTSIDFSIDDGTLAAGTLVNSHMIFLNSAGGTFLSHGSVIWTFSDAILGVMSDTGGTFEAASSSELGNPATNYTVTFAGSGPAAPFNLRGIEGNNGTGVLPSDGYSVVGNTITVSMQVTEPGDWIRVITASTVPEPGTMILFGSGLFGLAAWRRFKKNA